MPTFKMLDNQLLIKKMLDKDGDEEKTDDPDCVGAHHVVVDSDIDDCDPIEVVIDPP